MSLKYYQASQSIRTVIPKKAYIDDYSAICDEIFDNADNVFYNEIEYEEHYGKRDFKKIPMVRVDSVVNYNTGIQVGDDYKVFIFMPDFPSPYFGMMFKWENNYWLVVNVNNLNSLSNSCEVRRCNNMLRFFDENGNKIYEPCVLDQVLRFTNNNDTSTIVTGKGEQYIWCQRNSNTELIKPNDRILFGTPKQRICFRLYAGGFGNMLNTITGDDNSPTLTQFYVEEYEINYQTDDLEGGFADARKYQLKISIDNNNTSFEVGAVSALNATVYNGDEVIDKEVVWSSSNLDVMSISENVCYAISEGKAILTAKIVDNESIFADLEVEVKQEYVDDVCDIIISPDNNYILEGETKTYELKLYVNGEYKDTDMVIKDISRVPRDKYSLKVLDNSFTLTNKNMYLDSPIEVQCECNECTKTFKIRLRGVY